MRHQSRLAVIVLALAAGAFAGTALADDVPRKTAPPTGISLIGARCVFCHGPMSMLAFSRKKLDAGGAEGLDDFLAAHHAPDDEARAAIVKFLVNPMGGAN